MSALPVTRPAHWLLGGVGGDAALVTGDRVVSYAELGDLVASRRDAGPRRLTLIEAAPTLEVVVDYLAALADGHPVVLVGPGDLQKHPHLAAEYVPGSTGGLHPDLALLLSTSGSTGSPKLVRLSRTNVLSNAESIADYLDLRPGDVGITALPLHYCYGLSVLHSHLAAGAAVVLTDLSVTDPAFWELVADQQVTGVAGVAHTYALLDEIGFGSGVLPRLPSLRYLTQAGGRMAPDRVRDYAELTRAHGVDLFVMYGQTEATARMAYVPPHLLAEHPDVIGVPIPGGGLRVDGGPVGELVYTGPNVMLGYARSRADLARGAEVTELRTGDLARVTPEGLLQVVGRIDRQAKVLGHRVDLDRVEAQLADAGVVARAVADPETLWVFTVGDRPCERSRARELLADVVGLRGAAARVVPLDRLPVTAAGKPDDAALRVHIDRERALGAGPVSAPVTAADVRDVLSVVLGRPSATVADSFVDLGGDSLSHVEVSTRLASRMGDLPRDWPSMSATALAAHAGHRRRPSIRTSVQLDLTVALRALAIVLIVVTHADLAQLQGGAHVLLAVVGYNLARFQLAAPDPRDRVRNVLRSAGQVAVPSVVFIGALALGGRTYDWPTAALLNGALGSDRWDDQWHFWFIEALVWSFVGLAALLCVPPVTRALTRDPFRWWLAALAASLAVRLAWTGLETGATERYTTVLVIWCVALGACAATASTTPQRVLVALLTVVATYGYFGDVRRESIVVLGVLLLVANPTLRLPARLVAPISTLAAASLWIYLTHWQVYRPLEDAGHPVWAVVASLVVGVVAHELVRRTPLVGGHGRVARSRA